MAADTPFPPGPGVSQPEHLLWREVDRLDRRIDDLTRRFDQLDQHGSRGVEALRSEVVNLRNDFAQHEQLHEREADDRRSARRWGLGLGITAAVALVGPLYPLILVVLHR